MYACTGGTISSTDSCKFCTNGSSPSPDLSECAAVCGDGLKHPQEECEDENLNNGDGCSSTCTIEPMYICDRGSATRPDGCDQCQDATSPNAAKNR